MHQFILLVTGTLLTTMSLAEPKAPFRKPNKEQLKKTLSATQYAVTQEDDTERPFKNEYWDNHQDGIYVDVVSGEALFSSLDKYESGTGWPSFTRPINDNAVTKREDRSLFSTRTEVRSKVADSHLGHVFDDGPKPTGLRYCMNSAALRFIAVQDLEKQGYGKYQSLFTAKPMVGEAIFAGGCFWCMEPPFEKLDGVLTVVSGYTGGSKKNPTYEEVSAGTTGHAEAVKITFDPHKVSYEKLLDVFWHNIDPVAVDAQFCDHGRQYRSAIFYVNDEQKQLAQKSKELVSKSAKITGTFVTEITAATEFYAAEEYHQDYYKKNPIRYKFYRGRCGRDDRLNEVWK